MGLFFYVMGLLLLYKREPYCREIRFAAITVRSIVAK